MNAMPGALAGRFRSETLAARIARPLVNHLLPSGPVEIVVRSGPGQGLRLIADPLTEKYYWTGSYERAVQASLVSILQSGSTFWDVGAHVGFFTLIAARLIGAEG